MTTSVQSCELSVCDSAPFVSRKVVAVIVTLCWRCLQAKRDGILTKPLIAWCIGTCARMFKSEVQCGHAGSCANAERETATAKNEALRAVGVHVPTSFDELDHMIRSADAAPHFLFKNCTHTTLILDVFVIFATVNLPVIFPQI